MGKLLALEGQVFGKLTVIRKDGHLGAGITWLCQCSCGNQTSVTSSRLIGGTTRSCGCLTGKHGNHKKSHGHTTNYGKSPTYSSWHAIVGRITQPSNGGYLYYKKLGVTICDRWLNGDGAKGGFECFLEDMGERPSLLMSLDRINNDGNYEPGNCCWATRREQANNRRTNKHFEYQGEMMTFAELVRRTGMGKECLRHRLLRAGWTVEEAINAPKQQGQRPAGTRPYLTTPP